MPVALLSHARLGRNASFPLAVLAFGTLAVALGTALRTKAVATPGTFIVVPSDDGYGMDHCLANGSACGAIVAQAWCRSNGHQNVHSFGRAGDQIEGFAERPEAASLHALDPDTFIVSCAD